MREVAPNRCPFCNSPDTMIVPTAIIKGENLYQVFCRFCGATGPAKVDKKKAVEMWNGVVSEDMHQVMIDKRDTLFDLISDISTEVYNKMEYAQGQME